MSEICPFQDKCAKTIILMGEYQTAVGGFIFRTDFIYFYKWTCAYVLEIILRIRQHALVVCENENGLLKCCCCCCCCCYMTKLGSLWVYVFKVACFYPELPRLSQGRAQNWTVDTICWSVYSLPAVLRSRHVVLVRVLLKWTVKCWQRYQNS